jgi:hypothetical protein
VELICRFVDVLVLTFPLKYGDPATALQNINDVVLTASKTKDAPLDINNANHRPASRFSIDT